MSRYHDLAGPMEKEAMPLLRAAGRSLLTKGVWGSAAKAGEKLALRGGRTGQWGQRLTSGANAMKRISGPMMAYGAAGMVGDVTGAYDLPGSTLAFNIGMPGIGLAAAVPAAIRSARLAGGGQNEAIANDARAGARQAGVDWIDASQDDGRTAYDPVAYQKYLQGYGMDTSQADRYLNGNPVPQRNWWQRLGDSVTDPTQAMMPEVQRQIYDQMRKGASMEKVAWAAAMKAAWKGSRAVIPAALSPTYKAGPSAGLWRSGRNAIRAGVDTTTSGRFINRQLDKVPGGAFNALTTVPFVGYGVIDGIRALGEDQSYDSDAVQQEGYAAAQAAIRERMAKMSPWERQMVQFDPSLAVQGLENKMPGSIAGWEQQRGQAYQPGILSGVRQAWSGRGTPEFYSYDGAGNANYL